MTSVRRAQAMSAARDQMNAYQARGFLTWTEGPQLGYGINWLVTPNGGIEAPLRSLREVAAFLSGIAVGIRGAGLLRDGS